MAKMDKANDSFLNKGVTFEGSIKNAGNLLIEGANIKGTIEADGNVNCTLGAIVSGNITAVEVILGENVDAQTEIHASKKLTVKSSARLTGNVTTSCLVTEEGSSFQGMVNRRDQSEKK